MPALPAKVAIERTVVETAAIHNSVLVRDGSYYVARKIGDRYEVVSAGFATAKMAMAMFSVTGDWARRVRRGYTVLSAETIERHNRRVATMKAASKAATS